jgi:hypothetical protein
MRRFGSSAFRLNAGHRYRAIRSKIAGIVLGFGLSLLPRPVRFLHGFPVTEADALDVAAAALFGGRVGVGRARGWRREDRTGCGELEAPTDDQLAQRR